MAGSILRSFVSGTRQVLATQLIVSIGAVALAGWTLSVTNEVIRERDRLRERVIQLEEEMGTRGIVVPSPTAVVDTEPSEPEDAYPDEVGLDTDADPSEKPPSSGAPSDEAPPDQPPSRADPNASFNPGQVFTDLFAPAPPMRTLVLHARNERDAAVARRLAETMSDANGLRVIVNTTSPRDQREPGYSYYDGRQSRAAAALVAQFNQLAREHEIASWSAQLRGVALPSQGEYTADRTDIVLPALPAPQLNRVDPRLLEVQPQERAPAPIR
jgi:hypothetical protein